MASRVGKMGPPVRATLRYIQLDGDNTLRPKPDGPFTCGSCVLCVQRMASRSVGQWTVPAAAGGH